MSKCEHELWERESACADGYCPFCSAARIKELERAISNYLNEPMVWSIQLPEKDIKLYYQRTRKLVDALEEI
jgi:hypothetical protein